jgi:hypothetical protein
MDLSDEDHGTAVKERAALALARASGTKFEVFIVIAHQKTAKRAKHMSKLLSDISRCPHLMRIGAEKVINEVLWKEMQEVSKASS